MKSIFLFLFLGLFSISINAQQDDYDWTKTIGGSAQDNASSLSTDTEGNLIIVGQFMYTVDFDAGPDSLILSSNANWDAYIMKLDINGDFLWAKNVGGTEFEFINDVYCDLNNNIYITGAFSDEVDFDPGTDEHIETSNGDWDSFVLKLDSNGVFIWVRTMGGSERETGHTIITDALGNVYVGNSFHGLVDFDPGTEIQQFTSNGGHDMAIQKFDSLGNLLWVKHFGGSWTDIPRDMDIDINGSLYIGGHFSQTVDFDPSSSQYEVASNGNNDSYVLKLNEDGDLIWVKTIGGQYQEYASSITTDQYGNVYTTGRFQNNIDLDPNDGTSMTNSNGGDEIYIQKLDSLGDFIWGISQGSNIEDVPGSIRVDNNNHIFISGRFKNSMDFDPSNNSYMLSSNGNYDAFIQKLNEEGELMWVNSFGGSDYDIGSSIHTDNFGNVYLAGSFQDTAVFDLIDSTLSISHGGEDIYIQKYNILVFLGIDDAKIKNNPIVYPNPTNGMVTIELGDRINTQLRIYSLSGKIIHQENHIYTSTYNFYIEAQKGVYIIEILSDNYENGYFKLIKE